MTILGRTLSLSVTKIMDFGYYLESGDEFGEVLLPKKHALERYEIDDEVEVFIYLDSSDKPIATTQKPKAEVGEFAFLTVTDTNRFGAFADWGLDKEVMIPFAEQHKPLEVGHSYIVYLYIDKIDQRITGTTKIDKHIADESPYPLKQGQTVGVIIANSTDLGIKAIINNTCWGLIHNSDIYEKLSFGQSKRAFIKQVRPDGKINLTLNGGGQTRDRDSQKIIAYLNEHGGSAPFHDKSDSKLISRVFGMSKNSFKKAIGGLYKSGDLVIEKTGIKLAK